MLAGFDLVEEPTDGSGLVRIKATPKSGRDHPRIISATIEVDPRSKEICRLTIVRGPRGRAAVDVAFTLVDSDPKPASAYTLEGHVKPDADVFGPDRPGRRRLVLLRHLEFLARVRAELR